MRIRLLAVATVAVALAIPAPASAQTVTDQIRSLEVAAEQPGGYNRDALNINYDRDAVLDRNADAFGDCDGYFSRYDATCHSSGDDVQIDHLVAVREAWDSGLRGGDAWENFDGDMANLAVMTSELNQSKSDADPADWTPSNAACHYLGTYVGVKVKYDLSVDQAEKAALLNLAGACSGGDGGNGNGDGGDQSDGNGGQGDDEDTPDAPQPEPVENDLEVTG